MKKRDEIQIRDPYILAEGQVYYLFGTTDADPWKDGCSFECYRSGDLMNFEGPVAAFTPPEGFWANKNFWAPEVHKYRDGYYMFASFHRKGMRRGTQILKAEQPMGPYRPITSDPYTPRDWDCLDGTLFVEDGRAYSVFVHEWIQCGDGTMELVELAPDLSRAVTTPKTLFHASDAPWSRPIDGSTDKFVTDGPFLWRMECGTLAMLWSSFGQEGYALGAAYSENGVAGPWVQEEQPIFRKDGGHGMIFRKPDGTLILTIHCPNQTPLERPHFFEIREAAGKLALA